jgi:hypothetical protein
VRVQEALGSVMLNFRVASPKQSTLAELFFRNKPLGQITLPVVGVAEYLRKTTLQMPTVAVRLGAATVACQTYVHGQSQGWVVSAVLHNPAGLLPLTDLGLRVQVRRGAPVRRHPPPDALVAPSGAPVVEAAAVLSTTQLRAKQALVSVALPKPRRQGEWCIAWVLGEKTVAEQSLRAISKQRFLRSLHVAASRFFLQDAKGQIQVERFFDPDKSPARVGPCFLLTSSEPGIAGQCCVQVRVLGKGPASVLPDQEVLVSDGPTPVAPGTIATDEVGHVKGFELRCGKDTLARLPLSAAPQATFTAEGGFQPPEVFDWNQAAEELLHDKLNKLMKS